MNGAPIRDEATCLAGDVLVIVAGEHGTHTVPLTFGDGTARIVTFRGTVHLEPIARAADVTTTAAGVEITCVPAVPADALPAAGPLTLMVIGGAALVRTVARIVR